MTHEHEAWDRGTNVAGWQDQTVDPSLSVVRSVSCSWPLTDAHAARSTFNSGTITPT